MKDQVLKFLGDLPKAGSDQFNKALELLRKSKGHDAGKLRFYNNLGYSADRLESLLYDLKKQYGVTDVEVATAARASKETRELKIYVAATKNTIALVLERLKDVDGIMAMELPDALNLYTELENNLKGINEEDLPEDLTGSLYEFGSVLAQCNEAAANDSFKDLKTVKELGIAYSELLGNQSRSGLENVDSTEVAEKQLEAVKTDNNKALEEKLSESRDIVSEEGKVIIPALEADNKEETTSDDKLDESAPVADKKEETTSDNKLDEAATEETSEFLKKLDSFDVEAEVYNAVKSFAAEVSKETGEDPKDQKSVTLKAFIVAAKKKHFPA